MAFTFVHTADWQIGKRFGGFTPEQAPQLRAQRLDAVDRVGAAGMAAGAAAVLVAGDVFDSETVPEALVETLLSRLRAYPKLAWHLLPGNHDPARSGGVWETAAALGLPANVRVHLSPAMTEIAPGVMLLPAPLASKSTARDPTAWMDGAGSPAGAVRIGLAHGSVQGFGSNGEANVPIDPARVKSAGLAYMALGDWHGTMRISDRVWYSGTPEPDGFRDNEPGHALVVRVNGTGTPAVERIATAHFTWMQGRLGLESADGLREIEAEVDALGAAAARRLIALKLEGAVALQHYAEIEQRLARLGPRLFHLEYDVSALTTFAADTDLEAMGSAVLGTVARRLKARAEGGGDDAAVAARALRKLFALSRRIGGEECA
jgi:DNA repair exonuclease SbcCD nuclease subunit